jgi:hypothetical protein
MKRTQIDQLLGTAGGRLRPWATVDPEPVDSGDGGGGGSDEGGDGAPLGPNGEKALQDERVLRKTLAKELEDLRAQMEQMKGLVDPKVYAQAQAQAAALRQQLDDKERLSAEERQRLEAKANDRVSKAEARATKAEADRIQLQVKTFAQGLFLATDGRDGGDGSGKTYFDAWFAFHGSQHQTQGRQRRRRPGRRSRVPHHAGAHPGTGQEPYRQPENGHAPGGSRPLRACPANREN